ncbi:MAG: NAD-dependent deacylase [Chloroflexi bacterium]|nr:NAD-dependent deacylase [Chloroflexota bacterium]
MERLPVEVIRSLKSARRCVILTGAGVSVESGIPTFRDAETGLWTDFKPEDVATPEAFERYPERVWGWYEHRRRIIAGAAPNAAHYALARLEDYYEEFCLVTQNISGLHRAAGSRNVLELHGNIWRTRCSREGKIVDYRLTIGEVKPPRCACGAYLRPDVVWFGEPLPQEELSQAYDATARCQVLLSIGTSGVVQPSASLPVLARQAEALVIEVNPETTSISAFADYTIRGKAGEIVPALVDAVLS